MLTLHQGGAHDSCGLGVLEIFNERQCGCCVQLISDGFQVAAVCSFS